jgi:hypothetical protein
MASAGAVVAGITIGADRRAGLPALCRRTTSPGSDGSSPGLAIANPPSPTPKIVPAAAAIFQLTGVFGV